jgi:hypothetical protein
MIHLLSVTAEPDTKQHLRLGIKGTGNHTFKPQHFGHWILSLSSGKPTHLGPISRASPNFSHLGAGTGVRRQGLAISIGPN